MRKSKLRLGSLIVLLGLTLTAVFGAVAQAQPTTLYLNPPDYVFPESTPVGTRFNVSVYVSDAVNVAGAQLTLEFNDTAINVTRFFAPKDNSSYLFYGKVSTSLPDNPPDITSDLYFLHKSLGHATVTGNVFIDLLANASETPANGSGVLCLFEFSIKQGSPPSRSSVLALDVKDGLNDTYLLDINNNEIQGVTKIGGTYTLVPEFLPAAVFSIFIASTTTAVLLRRKRMIQKFSKD